MDNYLKKLTLAEFQQFSSSATVLQFTIPQQTFERIAESNIKIAAPIVADFSFDKDLESLFYVKLQAEVALTLECQRCLQPYEHRLFLQTLFSPVHDNEEACLLPADYEPVLIENGELSLLEILEEEIILSLPIIPKHEQCETLVLLEHETKRKNPFSVLKGLKDKDN